MSHIPASNHDRVSSVRVVGDEEILRLLEIMGGPCDDHEVFRLKPGYAFRGLAGTVAYHGEKSAIVREMQSRRRLPLRRCVLSHFGHHDLHQISGEILHIV